LTGARPPYPSGITAADIWPTVLLPTSSVKCKSSSQLGSGSRIMDSVPPTTST
jgi:hypothetical protein